MFATTGAPLIWSVGPQSAAFKPSPNRFTSLPPWGSVSTRRGDGCVAALHGSGDSSKGLRTQDLR